ncbi:tigger transposable element-derived protein 4-like [Stylophora pistillata]|uniref:tigger transposable element-derived protein 4-like n=1 Tax=Stylophora pistillata TaxID=50429 RepID=UPI000C03ADD4|nr:tigger transposable element-derived protein 4-like [Stylophora pistillata]
MGNTEILSVLLKMQIIGLIQAILLKKDEILKDYESNLNGNIKRVQEPEHEEIDQGLLDWFRKARSKNIPVTRPMLQEKATRIAEASEVSGEQFKASNGWPDRFKRRTGIKAKFISGESGDVREETVADSWIERLPVILQGWHPRDIWNMGERGQFFRALPNRSLTEASQSCTGGKKSKDRLTCAFIVNARGGKEKPIIIGESANPKCFRGIQNRSLLPCEYFNQPKASMNSDILMEILSKLSRRLSREDRSVILFMDNAPCHPEDVDDKFDEIKIVFFPKIHDISSTAT